MKIRIFFSAVVLAVMSLYLTSCDNDVETLEIQKLTTYDAQYFENLRKWKQSPHEITYAYYAAWHNTQNPTSWGERLIGLPDSMDVVNLWAGLPTPESFPTAYQDMLYCQEVKGTRFVMHADASNYNHRFWSRIWNEETEEFEYVYETKIDPNTGEELPVYETVINEQTGQEEYVLDENGQRQRKHVIVQTVRGDEESIRQYARFCVDTLLQCGLDGVDTDYEGWTSNDLNIQVDEFNKYFGPDGKWPEKLVIVDFFSSSPSTSLDDIVDFYVRQQYTWQVGFRTDPGGHPYEKVVQCESTGAESTNGGKDGARVKDFAAWEPPTGHKCGIGAFYLDYNYMSTSGIPYKEFREAIQIMNPAIHK